MDFSNIKIEKELQIVFMGTPEFSVPVLQGLIDNYKVRAVVTQPDRKGNHGQINISPVKKLAQDKAILVLQPEKIKEDYQEIINLKPDLIVTCAYGQIIPKELIECPRLGCINVHASLLPKLRGGAPIHKAIIEGHSKTGITIMYMNTKMDEGDIITQEEIPILDTDTASLLHDKLSILGKELLLKTLPNIINGTNSRIKQDSSQATYAFTLKKEDEKLNFNKTARQIYNQIRGLNSWPGAYCIFEGKILKVWDSFITENYPVGFNGEITAIYKEGIGVKVSNGEIVLKIVQPEGKNKMDAISFINGLRDKNIVGKVLE
ncbi:MAG TPA: methionyl-tRNA formyltransferase [Candidatus Faecisoma merdavium]|nr:methionyl-tRNA formyltransferase [Candidatus Faecisoma merdavium]